METRGTDEVDFQAFNYRQFIGTLSERKSALETTEPKESFGYVGVQQPFALLAFLTNPDSQRTSEGHFRRRAYAAEAQIYSPKLLSHSLRIAVLMLTPQLDSLPVGEIDLAQSPTMLQGIGNVA